MKSFEDWFENIESSSLNELKNELYLYAVMYHKLRNEWYFADDEGKKEIDDRRTRSHNVLIDNCNIMSRNIINAGENADWQKELGDDRKVIGDFACYVSYRVGVKARLKAVH